MSCSCVLCEGCGGTGDVWISFSGKYLGRYRCDDLDELDTCPDCNGSGSIEMCNECQEEARDEEWIAEMQE